MKKPRIECGAFLHHIFATRTIPSLFKGRVGLDEKKVHSYSYSTSSQNRDIGADG